MKVYTLIAFAILSHFCYGQNIYSETANCFQKIDGYEFGTYQFVDASYSASRATLPIITTKQILLQLVNELPKLRGKKKEYTDYWILGLPNLNPNNFTESDRIVIDQFYVKIQKYRTDNNLPLYGVEQLKQLTVTILSKSNACNFFDCRVIKLK